MKFRPSRFYAASLAALLIALFTVSAYAQFQTGNIYGKVQSKDGSLLPGVTVTLTGEKLIGGAATQISDAAGTYRFDRYRSEARA